MLRLFVRPLLVLERLISGQVRGHFRKERNSLGRA